MYKFYIVILLTILNFHVFSQNGNTRSFYSGISSGINYPVYNGINGLKFSVPLIIELGLTDKSVAGNDWFIEFEYYWGKEKESTNYFVSYDSTRVDKYFHHEVKNKIYSLHIGTRLYLKNGPFLIFSAGLTSKQYSKRTTENTNMQTGEKIFYESPGYGFNSVTFRIGIGKEFDITDHLTIYPNIKAYGTFYLIIPYFYSASLQVMTGYKF